MSKKFLEEMRGIAGLPLMESDKEHIAKEERLFHDCIAGLNDVVKMCEERLNDPASGDVTPEQKKQYEELHKCAKNCSEVMKKHLESYK